MKHFLVFIFCIIGYSSFSQDWRTIQISDTTYFRLDTVLTNMPPSEGTLRVIWVDSTKSIGNDKISYFYKTLRVANQYLRAGYIDTNGSSWLGEKYIRKQNGDEYYLNFLGDSILFKTNAKLNDSWIVAKDTSGIDFWGTLFLLDTLTIDGILDSTKTIHIQAKNAGIAVAHEFNNRNFTLSKEHGFVNVQQLISYPYFFDFQDRNKDIFFYGLGMFSRLPTFISNLPLDHINLSWKYAVGNAFQKTETYKNDTGYYIDTTITTDYVTNYISYGADSGHAFISRQSDFSRWVFGKLDTFISKSFKLIDTVVNHSNASNTIRKTIWPEAKVYSADDYLAQIPNGVNYNVGANVNYYCDGKKIRINKHVPIQPEIFKDSIGYSYYPIRYHYYYSTYSYFEDLYYSWQTGGYGPSASIKTNVYTSYKLGDCLFGKHLDFPAGALVTEYPVIYPNPVTAELNISNLADEYEYKIYNTLGQNILYGIGTYYTKIQVGHLSRGMYFIFIGDKIFKFVKQ